MKILITGGAGFIGKKLSNKLKNSNKVFVLDLPKKIRNEKKNLKGITIIEADIRKKKMFDKLKFKPDVVFHLAALCSTEMSEKYPEQCIKTNVNGTRNLLNWCAKKNVKKIVYTSSMAVYGKNAPNISENSSCNPISVYGKTKFKGENILLKKKNEIKIIILRLFNVYGPGQDLENQVQGMFSIYLSHLLKYKMIFVKGSLNRVRDFVFVDDVVSALKYNYSKSDIYNVGNGKPTSVINVIKLIFKNLKIKYNKKLIKIIKTHSGDTNISYANISKIKKVGWFPKYDIKKGSFQTIQKLNLWK